MSNICGLILLRSFWSAVGNLSDLWTSRSFSPTDSYVFGIVMKSIIPSFFFFITIWGFFWKLLLLVIVVSYLPFCFLTCYSCVLGIWNWLFYYVFWTGFWRCLQVSVEHCHPWWHWKVTPVNVDLYVTSDFFSPVFKWCYFCCIEKVNFCA